LEAPDPEVIRMIREEKDPGTAFIKEMYRILLIGLPQL